MSFTFPTRAENTYIVDDKVNVTWTVVAPFISLFESCGPHDEVLQDKVKNTHSYVWVATQGNYVQPCFFVLQPFSSNGESFGNNVTSVSIGVRKRFTDDGPPVEFNFARPSHSSTSTSATATATATATTTFTTSSTTTSPSMTTSPTETTSFPATRSGLSQSAKIGIGVGVSLGVLLVAACIGAFLLYRRRKSRKYEEGEVSTVNRPIDGLAPLPTFEYKDPPHNPARLSNTETVVSELSAENYRHREERPVSELMAVD
ncbi:uncharacterized protein ATNIH1004_009749 [Aspergillus tanneri]|uniref:Mid2 domain-containing protein n=1 Tax=Aspergillus tanneri TaxID=1220188 RepID=A0A5M9MJK3_9EURO|nr:uncharacterized protein ATNIH1004_009749 [Aspergillus tanneri]KAA8642987.1 hypothetical protein ATNIH1004_009749 [Aspergillus tanneri]